MRRRGARTVEVRPDAAGGLQRTSSQRMPRGPSGPTGGCASWYLDANGRNSTLWPAFTWPFRERTREFDEGAYTLGAEVPEPSPATARVAAQRVLDPRLGARLDPDDRPRPVRAALGAVGDEGGLQIPVAGVPEPGPGRRGPLGAVVLGQRPGPVGVAEEHVLGAGRERLRDPPHREQAGATQLGACQLGLERAKAQAVERLHGCRDRDPAEPRPAPAGACPSPGSRRCATGRRRARAPCSRRPAPGRRRSRRAARAPPRSRRRSRSGPRAR